MYKRQGDYYHISLNNLPDREEHPDNGEIRIDRLYAVNTVQRIEANMGEGDDIIKIYDDIDADLILRGGPGHDTIVVGKQKPDFTATLYGDAGNDQIRGNSNPDTIYGGPDADVIQGLGGNDILYGEGGDDRMLGGEGDDLLYGGDETGEKSGDRMQGGPGNDLMFGGSGHDHITGDEGNDWISGEDGNDTLVGDGIIDDTDGFTFSDVLLGGPGDDDLTGNIGRDYIVGDAGDDSINWKMAGAQTGAGSTDENAVAPGDEVDHLIDGGDGSDTFFVTSSKSAEGDTIVLAREKLSTSPVGLPGHYVEMAKKGHNPSLRAKHSRDHRAVRISVSTNSLVEHLDSTTTENLVINAGPGEDEITLNDLNGSDVKHIEFDLGSGGGWTTKQEDALDSYSTGTVTVENATDGSIVTLNGGASGSFKLQLGDQTTDPITYSNTKTETATRIQAALTGLGMKASVESISNTDSYKIDFWSPTADSVAPLQFVETNLTALKPAIGVSQNSIQRLALEQGTGGTFRLQFGNDPDKKTDPIIYSADPTEMATNISNALQSVVPGDVSEVVSHSNLDIYKIDFSSSSSGHVNVLKFVDSTAAAPPSGYASRDNVYTLSLGNQARKTFKLQLGTAQTDPIDHSPDLETTRAAIERALNDLVNVTATVSELPDEHTLTTDAYKITLDTDEFLQIVASEADAPPTGDVSPKNVYTLSWDNQARGTFKLQLGTAKTSSITYSPVDAVT